VVKTADSLIPDTGANLVEYPSSRQVAEKCGIMPYVDEKPEMLCFRIRQVPKVDRAPNTVHYSFDLKSPQIPTDVMHLVTRILEADSDPRSVILSFVDDPVTPSLLTLTSFRSFAQTLNVAMPTWPHFIKEQDGLLELLFLATMDTMQIVEITEECIWVATLPSAEFDSRMASLANVLSARLPADEAVRCLASLGYRLQR